MESEKLMTKTRPTVLECVWNLLKEFGLQESVYVRDPRKKQDDGPFADYLNLVSTYALLALVIYRTYDGNLELLIIDDERGPQEADIDALKAKIKSINVQRYERMNAAPDSIVRVEHVSPKSLLSRIISEGRSETLYINTLEQAGLLDFIQVDETGFADFNYQKIREMLKGFGFTADTTPEHDEWFRERHISSQRRTLYRGQLTIEQKVANLVYLFNQEISRHDGFPFVKLYDPRLAVWSLRGCGLDRAHACIVGDREQDFSPTEIDVIGSTGKFSYQNLSRVLVFAKVFYCTPQEFVSGLITDGQAWGVAESNVHLIRKQFRTKSLLLKPKPNWKKLEGMLREAGFIYWEMGEKKAKTS
jgi:hypothetical protein